MPEDTSPDAFDWDEIKSRLEKAQQSVENAENLSREQIEEVMKKRAELLARVPDESPDTSELLEVVRFRIGDEQIAIETRFAVEMVQLTNVTPIPEVEDFFLGISNLRGEITAIIDLGRFLGITSETKDASQALVLGEDTPDCAVLVDGIDHVDTIRKQDILAPSGGLGNIADLLIGCTAEALLILDGDALLQCERLFIKETDQ